MGDIRDKGKAVTAGERETVHPNFEKSEFIKGKRAPRGL